MSGSAPAANGRQPRGGVFGPPLVLTLAVAATAAVAFAMVAPRLRTLALVLAVAVLLGLAALVLVDWLRQRSQVRQGAFLHDGSQLQAQAPCYLTVLDRDLRIVDANEMFRSDFGDRLGDPCYLAFKGRKEPCPDCAAQRTFGDGRVHTGDEMIFPHGGSAVQVVETAAPMRGPAGEVAAVTLMATDVSESAVLLRELDQTRKDYERLFAAVPCFICVLDRELRIVEANSLYKKAFGTNPGSHCYEVCKKRKAPCTECPVERTLADGQVHTHEETLVTSDGQRLDVVAHTRPVLDDQGEITAVMEVFTDITEVKNLQRQRALMGRAVADMAHRIKNILMGLEGGIFVVNTGLETHDRASMSEGWEMVERNVGRVSRIVKDLLYCSKERTPDFQAGVCPQDIVLQVRDLYAARTAGNQIELRTELDPERHTGTFDPEGVHNLLCNLVANAIDACRFDPSEDKERHTITLRCRQNGDGSTVLEVEDDGAGIPEELNGKVFEDFFSSKGTEGTGIGLLVVQKVAEEHGGRVTFTTTPGRGTTFTVTLPG